MIEILREHNMGLNTESDWILTENTSIFDYEGKEQKIKSIQISWDGVNGELNGELIFLLSNDMELSTISKVLEINSRTNKNDSELLVFYPCFKYLKIQYKKNGITGGILSITMSNND